MSESTGTCKEVSPPKSLLDKEGISSGLLTDLRAPFENIMKWILQSIGPANFDPLRRNFLTRDVPGVVAFLTLLGLTPEQALAQEAVLSARLRRWLENYEKLPMAQVNFPKITRAEANNLPNIQLLGPNGGSGNGSFVNIANNLYILTAEHVADNMPDRYTTVAGARDMALMSCVCYKNNPDYQLNLASALQYDPTASLRDIPDVNGQQAKISGYFRDEGFMTITGKCLYTVNEVDELAYIIKKSQPQTQNRSNNQSSLDRPLTNRFCLKIDPNYDLRGISGGPVFVTSGGNKGFCGVVIEQVRYGRVNEKNQFEGISLVIFNTHEDARDLLDLEYKRLTGNDPARIRSSSPPGARPGTATGGRPAATPRPTPLPNSTPIPSNKPKITITVDGTKVKPKND